MTFFEETLNAVEASGHTATDVMFVGSADGRLRLPWDKFASAADFTYDSGFGGQEIASDLIVYFKDQSYMKRGEYDGSEWWEYNIPKSFSENDDFVPYKLLCVRQVDRAGWMPLEEINSGRVGYGSV